MCDRFDFSYLSDEAKKGFMDSLWEINKTQVGAELLSSLDKSEKILLRQDEKQDCAGYYSPDFNILSISAFPLNAEVLFHELVHAREDSEFKIQSGDLEKMKSDIDVTNTLAELFARVRSCRFVTEYNSNSDKKIEPWIKKDAEFFQKVFNENVEKYPTNTEEENLKLAETAMAEQVFKEIKDFSAKGWKSFFELSANKEEGFSPKDWFCSYFLTPIKGFFKDERYYNSDELDMYNYDFLKKELNLPYSEEKIKALFKEAKANLDKADKIETAEYQNATAITETRGEDSKKIFKFDDGTVKIVESGWDERVAAYNTEGRKVFENTGACENYYSSDNSRLSFNEKCAELGFAKKDKIESLIFPKGNNAQEFIYEISSDRPTLFEGENAKFIQNDDLQKKLQVHFKDNKITSFKMILELEKAEYIDKTVFENVVVNYSNNHIDMYLEKETDYPKHGYMGSLKNITEKTKLSKTGEMVTTVTTIDNTVKPVRERVEVVKESPYSEKAKKYKLLQPKMDEMLMEDFKKLEPFINLQSDYPNPEKKQQLCRNFFSEKISSISDVVKMCNAPEETLENEKNPLPLPPKLGKRLLSPVYLINKAKQKQ